MASSLRRGNRGPLGIATQVSLRRALALPRLLECSSDFAVEQCLFTLAKKTCQSKSQVQQFEFSAVIHNGRASAWREHFTFVVVTLLLLRWRGFTPVAAWPIGARIARRVSPDLEQGTRSPLAARLPDRDPTFSPRLPILAAMGISGDIGGNPPAEPASYWLTVPKFPIFPNYSQLNRVISGETGSPVTASTARPTCQTMGECRRYRFWRGSSAAFT